MSKKNILPSNRRKSVPTFSIFLDGNKKTDHKILSISVRKELYYISQCIITFRLEENDVAGQSDDFFKGKRIEIKAGYGNEEEPIFDGIITKRIIRIRNNFSVLELECRHQAVKMATKLNNRYFYGMTDVEIAHQLCNENGLSFEGESSELFHQELVQYDCTNWDFLLCRAEALGYYVTTETGSKICLKKPQFNQDPAISLVYGSTIKELDAEIDPNFTNEIIKTITWDPGRQQIMNKEAPEASVTANGNTPPVNLEENNEIGILEFGHPGLAENELQLWANSILKRYRLAKIKGLLKIDGNHLPRPGTLCELQNVGENLNGKVMITGVHHHIENGSWETSIHFGKSPKRIAEEFNLEQPLASGLLPAVHGLQIGVVSNLEDPEGAERIQVRLPLLHDNGEGAWMRLATLNAGADRGWVFRPEVGDEVITGFLNDDPRFGVILGSLHSSKNPAPYDASNDNNIKGYFSREKLEIVFNDDKKSISVQTPAGQKFVLSDIENSILLEDSHANKIVMSRNGIEISSKSDIKIKASLGLKMEGSIAAELSSSGSTTVKGSIVQIN